jgi:hypothetical protein
MAQTSVLVTAGPGRAVITINSDQSCPVLADVTTTSATWRRKTCPPSTRDEGTVSTTTYESGMSTLSAPYPLSATRTITSNYRVTHVFSTGGVGSCVGDGTETVTR